MAWPLAALFALNLLLSSAAEGQTSYTWNGTTGNWTNSTRWTPNGVPGVADNANIGSGTVTVNEDTTIGTLNLSSGVINGTGPLTVASQLNWSGGSFSGVGTVNLSAGGVGTISGSGVKDYSSYGTLNNADTLLWTGSGAINFAQGIWTNSGVLEIQNDASFVDTFDGAPMVFHMARCARPRPPAPARSTMCCSPTTTPVWWTCKPARSR